MADARRPGTARSRVEFLLGDAPCRLDGLEPSRMLLDVLRDDLRLTGTKEGCAEGDCGACTVLVGEPVDGGALEYRTVNACIRPAATVDRCHVLTVEHLRSAGGDLHPAQSALVAHHGSQCGFCTPGFVMSLTAVAMQGGQPSRGEVAERLQGNLCRCTGYRPIVDAALAMGGEPFPHRGEGVFDAKAVSQALRALPDGPLETAGASGAFHAPESLDELAGLLGRVKEPVFFAGATDVGLWITKKLRRPEHLVWLGRIAELRGIGETPEGLRIGALTSYSEARGALAGLAAPFGELISRIGGEQIRNWGTIGGNIANGSPIGDMPPPFIALGATLHLWSPRGRRSMKLEDFFIDYGRQDRAADEIVEAVEVPAPGATDRFAIYKISKRRDEDITAVLGAFRLEMGGVVVRRARLAFGGMGPVPARAKRAEAALEGRPFDAASVEAAAAALEEDFSPIEDMRASAAYRRRVAANLLRRFRLECAGEGPARLAVPA
ncbi:MAG: xanthine dehydrogenase small subunit [Flavobacteriaceae bacterium]